MDRHPEGFVMKIQLNLVLSFLKCDCLVWGFFCTIKTIYIFVHWYGAHKMNKTTNNGYILIFLKGITTWIINFQGKNLILTLRHWNFLCYANRLRNSMFKIFGLSIMRLILQVKHVCTLLSYYLVTFVMRIDFKMPPVLLPSCTFDSKSVMVTTILDMVLMIHYLTQWITDTIHQSTLQLKIIAIETSLQNHKIK